MPKFLFFKSLGSQYLLDKYPTGVAFAFSKYKLKSSAVTSIRASEIGLSEQDINLGAVEWDTAQIETFADGSLATAANMVDQSEVYGNIGQATKTKQPNVTDSSGLALDYFDVYDQGRGYVQSGGVPDMTGDYIISLVMRNETSTSNQRPTWQVSFDATNNFSCQIRRNGSSYDINYGKDSKTTAANDGYYLHTPANFIDWELYTIAVIGGVVKLYINGVEKTWGVGGSITDTNTTNVVALGIRATSQGGGRIFNYQTWIMQSAPDLSAFPLTDYTNDLMALHGIS